MRIRALMGIVGATGVAIALPLLAAERLAVKTGLWEDTATMQLSGSLLPAEQLQALPAEQRAQMEQIMKQMSAPQTMKEQSCVTAEDLDGRTFRKSMEEVGDQCEVKEVAATSKRQEYTFQCQAGTGRASGRMVIEVVSDTQVRGSMETTLPQGRMDVKFESKWLAANCGDVK